MRRDLVSLICALAATVPVDAALAQGFVLVSDEKVATVPGGQDHYLSANCPANTRVVGGGYYNMSDPKAFVNTASAPFTTGASGWTAILRNVTGFDLSSRLKVWAFCTNLTVSEAR